LPKPRKEQKQPKESTPSGRGKGGASTGPADGTTTKGCARPYQSMEKEIRKRALPKEDRGKKKGMKKRKTVISGPRNQSLRL